MTKGTPTTKATRAKRRTTRKTPGTHRGRLTFTNRAIRWAKAVASGVEIRNARVVRACERFLSDMKRKDIYLSPEAGNRACGFIELLQHVKGKWAGDRIKLEDFQCFIVVNMYGWLRKSDGLRRFRRGFVFMPRKNAKSTLIAAMAVYSFLADGEKGAEVFSGATTLKQALEVFRPAQLMCAKNRPLLTSFGVEVSKSNLACPGTDSKFEPIVGRPGDGASPSFAATDEYHEHRTSEQFDAMATGMAAREQPIHMIPTTAGTDISGPCHDFYAECCEIVDGHAEDDRTFALIFELDENDDWTDFENWKKVNPNFGVSVFEDFLRGAHKEAMERPSRQNIIRCKHLNQWLSVDSPWLNILEWDACKTEFDGGMDLFEGQEAWVGVDLASKVDLAVAVIMFRYRGGYAVFPRFYLPSAVLTLPENGKYRAWEIEGHLVVTPGERTDYEYIKADIREWAKRFDIQAVAFDPWQATQFSNEMDAEGLELVEVRATVGGMSEPMKELEALVKTRKLAHEGDPVLRWNASNVVCHYDAKDNVFPRKTKPQNKIDGIVAMIIALHVALLGEIEGESIYETLDAKDMF